MITATLYLKSTLDIGGNTGSACRFTVEKETDETEKQRFTRDASIR